MTPSDMTEQTEFPVELVERLRRILRIESDPRTHGGFLYGSRHVIRDFRKPHGPEQEVWSRKQASLEDYDECHADMMDELERIAIRAVLREAMPGYTEMVAALEADNERLKQDNESLARQLSDAEDRGPAK